jgi:alpha-L-fucosidase
METAHMKIVPAKAWLRVLAMSALCMSSCLSCPAQENPETGSLNQADRLEWFRDQGFGLFIHWSVDSQLGVTISHSLVGASEDYDSRFFGELPKSFDPEQFHPLEWARLARLAGVRYVMFTTKHHSGFCMFDTATTPFNIMNTPYHRDITRELFNAFRDQGIAPGVYFSPDDFYWLHEHGKLIERGVPEVQPSKNPGLLDYDRAQVRELLTHYGPLDLIFFDGEADNLRQLAWQLQPSIVVTRGALQTPEQYVPGMPLPGAWEANMTMGAAWQYQPRNEIYKSGRELIRVLIQTRAKGGNLLLDIGPKPNGELPIEQEERLRELALWMFVNSDAIYGVRPWVITNEGDVWFTRKKDKNVLYALVDSSVPWRYGEWNDLTLHSLRATKETQISVLGENGKVLEYQPKIDPAATWRMESDGLHIRAMRAQRLQDNHQWPNPVVLQISNVEAAFQPPQVKTVGSAASGAAGSETLQGALVDMGGSPSLQVGFEYRAISGEDVHARTEPWIPLPLQTATAAVPFSGTVTGLAAQGIYQFRAVVKHPLLTLYGAEMTMQR